MRTLVTANTDSSDRNRAYPTDSSDHTKSKNQIGFETRNKSPHASGRRDGRRSPRARADRPMWRHRRTIDGRHGRATSSQESVRLSAAKLRSTRAPHRSGSTMSEDRWRASPVVSPDRPGSTVRIDPDLRYREAAPDGPPGTRPPRSAILTTGEDGSTTWPRWKRARRRPFECGTEVMPTRLEPRIDGCPR